ncbi:hypothetical protein [Streptomyces diastatochromogenes]|uniref:hypothetical protein n=1 Tax=Streptomyces diastatochromogenes TaxID=42236 RepID=UPI00142E7622|nr:hypothetical protein [Streptomyces diastatochromogenes]MCZ0984617.1 hypothetical protein [Streptomyces diastatochromogenes]
MDDDLWALIEPLLLPWRSGRRGRGQWMRTCRRRVDRWQRARPSPDDPAGPDGGPECLLGDKAYDSKAVRGEL